MRKKLLKINEDQLNEHESIDMKSQVEKHKEERRIKNREAKIKRLKIIYHDRFDYAGKTNVIVSSQIDEDNFEEMEIGNRLCTER